LQGVFYLILPRQQRRKSQGKPLRSRPLPYLHTANVDGQHGGEEEHLQKEVGHQADDGEEAELLQTGHSD